MTRIAILTLTALALILAGCGDDDQHMDGDHGDRDSMTGMQEGGGDSMDHEDMEHATEASALPEGANQQCPVMGEAVDSAIFVEYEGKKVYFCCKKCIKKFEAEPEKYFAKAYPDAGK